MSREKQIEEMSTLIYENRPIKDIWNEDADSIAETLYNAGYRKQKDAKWVDNHCTACGMTPMGEEIWTKLDLTPPKYEYFMDYCPCCGAKMKGGAE